MRLKWNLPAASTDKNTFLHTFFFTSFTLNLWCPSTRPSSLKKNKKKKIMMWVCLTLTMRVLCPSATFVSSPSPAAAVRGGRRPNQIYLGPQGAPLPLAPSKDSSAIRPRNTKEKRLSMAARNIVHFLFYKSIQYFFLKIRTRKGLIKMQMYAVFANRIKSFLVALINKLIFKHIRLSSTDTTL